MMSSMPLRPSITTTSLCRRSGINPNVGRAKQVRPTIDAGSIYSTIASLAACRGVDSTCFAPTTDDRNDSVDARNANDAGKHND